MAGEASNTVMQNFKSLLPKFIGHSLARSNGIDPLKADATLTLANKGLATAKADLEAHQGEHTIILPSGKNALKPNKQAYIQSRTALENTINAQNSFITAAESYRDALYASSARQFDEIDAFTQNPQYDHVEFGKKLDIANATFAEAESMPDLSQRKNDLSAIRQAFNAINSANPKNAANLALATSSISNLQNLANANATALKNNDSKPLANAQKTVQQAAKNAHNIGQSQRGLFTKAREFFKPSLKKQEQKITIETAQLQIPSNLTAELNQLDQASLIAKPKRVEPDFGENSSRKIFVETFVQKMEEAEKSKQATLNEARSTLGKVGVKAASTAIGAGVGSVIPGGAVIGAAAGAAIGAAAEHEHKRKQNMAQNVVNFSNKCRESSAGRLEDNPIRLAAEEMANSYGSIDELSAAGAATLANAAANRAINTLSVSKQDLSRGLKDQVIDAVHKNSLTGQLQEIKEVKQHGDSLELKTPKLDENGKPVTMSAKGIFEHAPIRVVYPDGRVVTPEAKEAKAKYSPNTISIEQARHEGLVRDDKMESFKRVYKEEIYKTRHEVELKAQKEQQESAAGEKIESASEMLEADEYIGLAASLLSPVANKAADKLQGKKHNATLSAASAYQAGQDGEIEAAAEELATKYQAQIMQTKDTAAGVDQLAKVAAKTSLKHVASPEVNNNPELKAQSLKDKLVNGAVSGKLPTKLKNTAVETENNLGWTAEGALKRSGVGENQAKAKYNAAQPSALSMQIANEAFNNTVTAVKPGATVNESEKKAPVVAKIAAAVEKFQATNGELNAADRASLTKNLVSTLSTARDADGANAFNTKSGFFAKKNHLSINVEAITPELLDGSIAKWDAGRNQAADANLDAAHPKAAIDDATKAQADQIVSGRRASVGQKIAGGVAAVTAATFAPVPTGMRAGPIAAATAVTPILGPVGGAVAAVATAGVVAAGYFTAGYVATGLAADKAAKGKETKSNATDANAVDANGISHADRARAESLSKSSNAMGR